MFETTMPEHYCPCAWAFCICNFYPLKGRKKKKKKLYQIENLHWERESMSRHRKDGFLTLNFRSIFSCLLLVWHSIHRVK